MIAAPFVAIVPADSRVNAFVGLIVPSARVICPVPRLLRLTRPVVLTVTAAVLIFNAVPEPIEPVLLARVTP